MTDELRDRLRYLRHLPVSSSFEVGSLLSIFLCGWYLPFLSLHLSTISLSHMSVQQ